MSPYDAFHSVIRDRVEIADKLHGGGPLWLWERIMKQFSTDIPLAIKFVLNEISDTELYWLSEVFDKLLLSTRSQELLDALRKRATSVQNSAIRDEFSDELDEAIGVAGMF